MCLRLYVAKKIPIVWKAYCPAPGGRCPRNSTTLIGTLRGKIEGFGKMTDEVVMGFCAGCECPRRPNDLHCAQCGLRRGAQEFWLSLVPAVATGLIISTLGVLAGRTLPLSFGSGLVHDLSNLVLGTTVPYFDIAFGFIGGWGSTVALTGRRVSRSAVAGMLVAVLYAGTLALCEVLASRLVDWERLAQAGGLALVGALLAIPLRQRTGTFTKLTAVARLIPGGRHVSTVVTTFIGVALALALYAMVVVAAIVTAIVIGLYIVFKIIGAILGGESRRPQLYIPKGGKIDSDGRIVREGLFRNSPTGQRIDEDGRVVHEGLLGDQQTGLRIDKDGRVLKEGLIFDDPTGIKLKECGSGKREIVHEGLILDKSTGLEISADGRAEETGLLWNDNAGVVIDGDGAHQVHADPKEGWEAQRDNSGDTRFIKKGIFGSMDAGVRLDGNGQGYHDRFLGEEKIDLGVDEQGLVKERKA